MNRPDLPPSPRCHVLASPLIGLENQARGLAEAAGFEPAVSTLGAGEPWRRLSPALWPDPRRAVGGLPEVQGGFVIGAGGMAGAVGASLRRRRAIPVVQVQNPRVPLRHFDLVVVNRHDEVSGPNVFSTRTALHRVTPARLAQARAEWAGRLAPPGRRLAVLVGGSNGRFRLDLATGGRLAASLAALLRADRNLAVAVTPSRRTDPAVTAGLRASLEPLGGTVWDGRGDNPYFGMLALADAVVVTGDSVSMVSEAVATSAPVFVAALPGRSRRIGLFLGGLLGDGRIRWFTGDIEPFPARALDDTAEAAQEMRRRLGLGGGG